MLTAIDLFAGAGGFSTGAQMAGVDVLWAANHWQQAVNIHAANHPGTRHSCQDLRQADFSRVPDHDILLASPACQGHSNAASGGGTGDGVRGSGAKHDELRATAWAIIDAVDAKRPPFLVIENVPEFTTWCQHEPEKGRRKCACGSRFRAWQAMLAEDYALSFNVLDSADFGIPQNRKRLYIVGVRGAKSPLVIKPPQLRVRGAEELVLLDQGEWTKVSEHKFAGVKRRVARAKTRGHGDAWLHQNVTGHPGRSLQRPMGTVTTKHQWAVVRKGGEEYRPMLLDEYREAMGFPADYLLPSQLTKAVKMLGNAVVPSVAAHVMRQLGKAA